MNLFDEAKKEKKKIIPYPHQQLAFDEVEGAILFGSKQIVIDAPTSFGKEQPYSEPVLTPNGWKKMGDLTLKDYVIGSDGKQKQITHIHEQGEKDVYEITFLDKTKVRCGADHLWTYYENVKRQKNNKITMQKVKRTENTITLMNKKSAIRQKRLYIKTVKPIKFNNNEKLPIDPYFLGLLLGDGSFKNKKISFSNNNKYIQEIIKENLPANDVLSNFRTSNNGKKQDFDISWNGHGKKGQSKTYNIIKELDLAELYSYQKFIPKKYLYSSIKNRKKLLQGLLDTDGHISHKTSNEFSTSSKQLAKDIIELARSLGLIVNFSTRIPTYIYNGQKKQGKKSWRIYIRWTAKYKTIINIKKLNYKEQSRCITINSQDHLYVTSGYTLTHNSLLMAMIAKQYQNDGIAILVNISQLIDQIAEHLDMLDADYSILKAGYEKQFDSSKKIQLIMTQTFVARIDSINLNLKYLIQDEAHIQWLTSGTKKVIKHLGSQIRVGTTATPYDAKGFLLENVDTVIQTISIRELESKGFLSPVRYYIPKWSLNQDYGNSVTLSRDYTQKEIDSVVMKDDFMNLAIEAMLKMNIVNKKTIVFCSSIEHAKTVTNELRKNGDDAYAYHSELSDKESKNLINQFKEPGSKKTLCAINRISIGFDTKDIEFGVSLRKTNVRSLWQQQVGRLIRPFPGKEFAELLDLSGNTALHGFHFEEYNPPVLGDMKALSKEREKLEKNIIKFIVKQEPTFITEEMIQIEIKRLEERRNNIQLIEMSILLEMYDSERNIEKIFELAAEINKRINGIITTKTTLDWMKEKWIIMLNDNPDKLSMIRSLLKNRMKKIIKSNKKLSSIHYFPDWIINESDFGYMFKPKIIPNYDINDEEVPF